MIGAWKKKKQPPYTHTYTHTTGYLVSLILQHIAEPPAQSIICVHSQVITMAPIHHLMMCYAASFFFRIVSDIKAQYLSKVGDKDTSVQSLSLNLCHKKCDIFINNAVPSWLPAIYIVTLKWRMHFLDKAALHLYWWCATHPPEAA